MIIRRMMSIDRRLRQIIEDLLTTLPFKRQAPLHVWATFKGGYY